MMRLLLAIAAGSFAGCADVYTEDPVRTARADSSAAGYLLGELAVADPDVASSADDSTGTAASADSLAPDESGTDPATVGGTATTMSAADSPDTAAISDSGAAAQPVPTPDSGTAGNPAPGDTSPGAPEVGTPPESLAVQGGDSIVVNTYLAFDPVGRVAWLDLIAGYDGANGALNFNGGHAGSHTMVVPVGWRVEVRFANRDHDLSHSATIVGEVDPIPVLAPSAVFSGAFSMSLEEGLVEGRTDVFRFSADRQGSYLIMCAVPGHGQSGMWIRLDVSRDAASPSYGPRSARSSHDQ